MVYLHVFNNQAFMQTNLAGVQTCTFQKDVVGEPDIRVCKHVHSGGVGHAP